MEYQIIHGAISNKTKCLYLVLHTPSSSQLIPYSSANCLLLHVHIEFGIIDGKQAAIALASLPIHHTKIHTIQDYFREHSLFECFFLHEQMFGFLTFKIKANKHTLNRRFNKMSLGMLLLALLVLFEKYCLISPRTSHVVCSFHIVVCSTSFECVIEKFIHTHQVF